MSYDEMKQEYLQDSVNAARTSLIDKFRNYLGEGRKRLDAIFLSEIYQDSYTSGLRDVMDEAKKYYYDHKCQEIKERVIKTIMDIEEIR